MKESQGRGRGKKKKDKKLLCFSEYGQEGEKFLAFLRVLFISRRTCSFAKGKGAPWTVLPSLLGRHLLVWEKILSVSCWSFFYSPISCKVLWSLSPFAPAPLSPLLCFISVVCVCLWAAQRLLNKASPVCLAVQNQPVGGCLLTPHLCIAVSAELFHTDIFTSQEKSPTHRIQIQAELHILWVVLEVGAV